jgi:hypothetical protein
MDGKDQRTRLLSDEPARTDAFEGGHDRVAEVLAGLIRDEEGGKAIALRGPYGSGKSTVIEILGEKIRTDGDTRIFTYDAWEHQGDPLRRSFIESLVDFLRDPEHEWAEPNAWENEIDRMARRKEKTEVSTEPKLTGWGRRVAVTLFVAPLGAFIVNNFISGPNGSIQWRMPEVLFWVGGVILFLLPLLLVLYAWARGNDPFYVFVRESHQKQETKTTKTPDPTTIEFQKIFQRILRGTLRQGDRQLILVVDNLDRLPAEDAFSTWATMRTFFQRKTNGSNDWENRLWLIVPFNFEALRSVFEDRTTTHSASGKRRDIQSDQQSGEPFFRDEAPVEKGRHGGAGGPSAQDNLQAFIDKTFTTTFRVAPPVLSDWESFMKDQLKKAFPKLQQETGSDEEFHAVYRLYRVAGVGKSGTPTPREIKLFINQLSTLYRQWGDKISLRVLAIYVLKIDEIDRNGEQITDPTFLSRRVEAELANEEWQRRFAALHFNVEDGALQILIGRSVREALVEGNSDLLHDQSNVTGFLNILESTVSDIVNEEDAVTSTLAATALEAIEIDSKEKSRSMWRGLLRSIEEEESWYPESKKHGDGVVAIFKNNPGSPSDRTARAVINAFSDAEIEDGIDWMKGVVRTVVYLDAIGYDEVLDDSLQVPGGGQKYIKSIMELSRRDNAQDLICYFEPEADLDEIDNALGKIADAKEITNQYAQALHLLSHVRSDGREYSWTWKQAVESLKDRASNGSDASEEELRGVLKTLLVMAGIHKDEHARNFLSRNEGWSYVLHHYARHRTDDDPTIACLCILLVVLFNPNVNRGNNSGSSNQGSNQLKSILNSSEKQDIYIPLLSKLTNELHLTRDIVEAADSNDRFSLLVTRILRRLADSSVASQSIDADLLCDYPQVVVQALNHNGLTEIVDKRLADGDLKDRLSEIGTERWTRTLSEEDRLLDLLLTSIDVGSSFRLSQAFRKALLEHAKTILSGKSPSRLKDEWGRLPVILDDEEQHLFFSDLHDLLLQSADQSINSLLELYGEGLQESEVIGRGEVSDPNELVDNRLIPILNRGNPTELRWLQAVIEERNDLMETLSGPVEEAFKKRLREVIDHSNAEGYTVAVEIADNLGLDLSGNTDDSGQSGESE